MRIKRTFAQPLNFWVQALIQCLQPGADFAGRDIGLLQQLAHGEEAVELARECPVGHCNAGLSQAHGVFVAFVAQGIGARGQDIGRRQPCSPRR